MEKTIEYHHIINGYYSLYGNVNILVTYDQKLETRIFSHLQIAEIDYDFLRLVVSLAATLYSNLALFQPDIVHQVQFLLACPFLKIPHTRLKRGVGVQKSVLGTLEVDPFSFPCDPKRCY